MKWGKKKQPCECGVTRLDLATALGAALLAVGKAVMTYVKYKKEGKLT